MRSMSRYDSRLAAGPIRTASSASSTCGARASASEYTAALAIPMRRSVRKMRRAISPRFATRTLWIGRAGISGLAAASALRSPLAVAAERATRDVLSRRGAIDSHAEHAIPGRAADDVGMHGRERDAEHGARVARIDDAVVPQASGGEEGVRLFLDLLLHHLAQRRVARLVERLPGALGGLAADDREHPGELLRTHHRDAMVGPREDEARIVRPPRHAVVAGAV